MAKFHAIGRRKTSVARVYMDEGTGTITVNSKDYKDYFNTAPLHYKLEQPFSLTETTGKYDVKVNVFGGGITGQAEAIRLGVSRILSEIDNDNIYLGDRKAYLPAVDTAGAALPLPDAEDTISGVGDGVKIVRVQELWSGDTRICYICQVRG